MYTDQGNFMRIDFLQLFTLPDRDQPVFCTVNDIGMAIHFSDPFIRSQMVT